MSLFQDDDEEEENDDQFAESILKLATSPNRSYVDVNDIVDAYNTLCYHGRIEDAQVVLNYGLEWHSCDVDLLLIRAATLIDNGKLDTAKKLLDYVKDDAQDKTAYYVDRGWLAIQSGNDNLAYDFFLAAVDHAHDEEERNCVAHEIASNLVQLERFEFSVHFFEQLPQEDIETNPQCAFEFAYALGQLEQDDRAASLYQCVLKAEPFNDSAWYNLGILYGKKGLIDKSIDAYETCISITPEYAEAFYNLGNTYLGLGQIQDAIESYTEYLSIRIPNAENNVFAYLGDCWMQLGNFELAKCIFELTVSKIPDFDAAWYDLGRCNIELGRFEEAVLDFQKAIELNKEAADYYFALAQAFYSLGVQDKTMDALENGLRNSPDDVLAWFEVVRLRMMNNDYHEVRDFINAKKAEYGSPMALQLVEAYVEFFVFGRKRTATSLLRKVAKSTPQIIKEASTEPDLSKLFKEKGIAQLLDEFNIKL